MLRGYLAIAKTCQKVAAISDSFLRLICKTIEIHRAPGLSWRLLCFFYPYYSDYGDPKNNKLRNP